MNTELIRQACWEAIFAAQNAKRLFSYYDQHRGYAHDNPIRAFRSM